MAPLTKIDNKKKKLKKCEGKIDIIHKLPIECSQEILLYLRKNDLASVWNCSRAWQNVMSSNYFWKRRCTLDDYSAVPDQNEKSKFFHQYVEKFDYYWQGVYSYYQMLFDNWKNNNFKKTLGHCSADHLHYFDENILILDSNLNKIKIIDVTTGNKVEIIPKVKIFEVYKFENYLVSVWHKMIIVWDLLKNGTCILSKTLPYFPGKIFVSKNVIASADAFNEQVFIYDFKGTQIYSHVSDFTVSLICVEDNIMAMGSETGDVNIVEFNSNNLARHLCSLPYLQEIMIKNGCLVCVLSSGFIHVYNIKTMRALCVLVSFDTSCSVTILNENKLVGLGPDQRSISVWDFTTGKTLLLIRNQYDMTYLASNSRFIVASVQYEETIKVWCCKTAKLITQISFSAIGMKDEHIFIDYAHVTDSKLVLRWWSQSDHHNGGNITNHLVFLNFENDRNIFN